MTFAGEPYGKQYLRVNAANQDAICFYERNGFVRKSEGTMQYKGRVLGEVLMEQAKG